MLTHAFCLAIVEELRNEVFSKLSKVLHTDLPKALNKKRRCKHHPSTLQPEHDQHFEAPSEIGEHRHSIIDTVETQLGVVFKAIAPGCCQNCVASRLEEHDDIVCATYTPQDEVQGVCLSCFDRTSDKEKCTGEGPLRFKCLP